MNVMIEHKVTYPATLHEWLLHLSNVPPEADGLVFQFIQIEEDHLELARNYAKYGGYPPWRFQAKDRYGWGSEFQKNMMLADTVEEASSYIEDHQVKTAYLKLAEIIEPVFNKYRSISDNAIKYCKYWDKLIVDGTEDILEMFDYIDNFRMDVYHIPYPSLSRGHTKGGANIPANAMYVFDSRENIKEISYYSTFWHEISHVLIRELKKNGYPSLGPLDEIVASAISSILSTKYFLTLSRWQYLLLSNLSLYGKKGIIKKFIKSIKQVSVKEEVLANNLVLRIESPNINIEFAGKIVKDENPYELRIDNKRVLVRYEDGTPVFRLLKIT